MDKKNQMKMLLIVIQGAQFSAGPIHTTPEKFKNATITGHYGFVFEENSSTEITQSLSNSSVFKMFSVHDKNEKPAFSNSCGLKSIFEKAPFS